MRHLRTLGPAAFLAVALSVIFGASSASATELTCTNPPGVKAMCPSGTVIQATSTHIVFHTTVGEITCTHSLLEAQTSNTGSPTETIKAPIKSLDFTNCGEWTLTVISKGTLEIHTHESDPQGVSGWGTLTSSGLEITAKSSTFHCIFSTNSTDLGTITGSTSTGGKAVLNTTGKKIPRTGGTSGFFCGSSAEMTGSYTINAPSWLDVDHAFL